MQLYTAHLSSLWVMKNWIQEVFPEFVKIAKQVLFGNLCCASTLLVSKCTLNTWPSTNAGMSEQLNSEWFNFDNS